jgi:integrase
VDRASDEEVVALLGACRSARDRLVVLLMARAGLRRGELCGLRRSDVHLLLDSRLLGCQVRRAHLRLEPNGTAKAERRSWTERNWDGRHLADRVHQPDSASAVCNSPPGRMPSPARSPPHVLRPGGPAAGPDGHSGVRIIRISSLVSSGASRSLPGQRPVTRQPSRA